MNIMRMDAEYAVEMYKKNYDKERQVSAFTVEGYASFYSTLI